MGVIAIQQHGGGENNSDDDDDGNDDDFTPPTWISHGIGIVLRIVATGRLRRIERRWP